MCGCNHSQATLNAEHGQEVAAAAERHRAELGTAQDQIRAAAGEGQKLKMQLQQQQERLEAQRLTAEV